MIGTINVANDIGTYPPRITVNRLTLPLSVTISKGSNSKLDPFEWKNITIRSEPIDFLTFPAILKKCT